jgi:hypothetical protein
MLMASLPSTCCTRGKAFELTGAGGRAFKLPRPDQHFSKESLQAALSFRVLHTFTAIVYNSVP